MRWCVWSYAPPSFVYEWRRSGDGEYAELQRLKLSDVAAVEWKDGEYCLCVAAMSTECVVGTSEGKMEFLSSDGGGEYEVKQCVDGAHSDWGLSHDFVPNENVVSGSSDGSIKVWSPMGGVYVELRHFPFVHDREAVLSVAVTADGLLLSGGYDQHLRLCGECLMDDDDE